MADPIADFLAITGCGDEEMAIELLSINDFDVQKAVIMFNESNGRAKSNPPANTDTNARSNTSTNAIPSTNWNSTSGSRGGRDGRGGGGAKRSDDDDDDAFDYGSYDADEELARALAASQHDHQGGRNDYQRDGSSSSYVPMEAASYQPVARRVEDEMAGGGDASRRIVIGGLGEDGGGGGATQLNKKLAVIDPRVDFDDSFILEHFGDMRAFRLPGFGCDGRYKYLGEDPFAARDKGSGIDENPIITRFRYCCAVAEEQKKFVFLLILRGERTFCDSCCIRDLFGRNKQCREFLEENFINFFQVVLPQSLDHVRHTQLSRLQTHQKSVKRMMHLNAFLSTYQIGSDPEENILPGGRFPPRVETSDQRKCYNIFCLNAFPIIAVINPQTQSMIRRIPLGSLYRARNNAAEIDAEVLMSELTTCLDSNVIGDNFFLRSQTEEEEALDAPPSSVVAAATTTPARQHSNTKQSAIDVDASGGGDTIPKKAAAAVPSSQQHDQQVTSVDDDDDYGYDYAYDDDEDDDNATPSHSVPNATAATVSENEKKEEEEEEDVSSIVIDFAPFLHGGASASDCLKLRIGTPKGQVNIEVSKTVPLRLFLAYLTALCTSNKMMASSDASGGSDAASHHKFIFDAELAAMIAKTRFLGGFPPKPLDIDNAEVLEVIGSIGSGEGKGLKVRDAFEILTHQYPTTLADWNKLRMNDVVRPSLP